MIENTLSFLIIADDNLDVRFVYSQLCKIVKFPVTLVVRNYLVLNDVLSRRNYDLILCKYNLNNFNGLNVLDMLQEKSITTPVFFISDMEDDESAQDTILSEVYGYILTKEIGNLSVELNTRLGLSA